MKHRASEVRADDRYHSLHLRPIWMYISFPGSIHQRKTWNLDMQINFSTTKRQDSTMSAAVFEPTVPLVERNIQGTNIRKVQQASKTRLETYSIRIPLTPSRQKSMCNIGQWAMEFPVTKALETEVQARRPWIHVPHVKNGAQTYKFLISEGQEVIWQWQTKTKAWLLNILVKCVTH